MSSIDETVSFDFSNDRSNDVRKVLQSVYKSLEEKGYNPVNQIVGYLLSGDPAYIPRHDNARLKIREYDRDEIMEELVKNYLEKG